MSDTYTENSITEKMRQVRPPSAPIKQVEKISVEAYQEATRPVTKQSTVNIKFDMSKLNTNK